MAGSTRWIRLNVGWEDSAWLDALDGVAAGCWPRLLCWVKRDGISGQVKRPSPVVAARRWRVPVEAVVALEAAAIAGDDPALVIADGDWVVTGWKEYQEQDSTARLRVRDMRARKATGKKWSDGLCCESCGKKKDLTRDHIVPHSNGGTDDPENIRVLCRSCNSSRGNRFPNGEDVTRNDRDIRNNRNRLSMSMSGKVSGTNQSTRTRKISLAAEWQPSEAHHAMAKGLGVDCLAEAEKMRDWAASKGEKRVDWDAQFRNWLKQARPSGAKGQTDELGDIKALIKAGGNSLMDPWQREFGFEKAAKAWPTLWGKHEAIMRKINYTDLKAHIESRNGYEYSNALQSQVRTIHAAA